jgi:uncharacterized small protein (DUF1192 family)
MQLYKLSQQYNEVESMFFEDDVNEQAIIDTLESIEDEIKIKTQSILSIITHCDRNISIVDAEIERLQAMKKSIEKKSSCLKDYLLNNMNKLELNKIECDLFTVTRVKGRDIANIINFDSLPKDYVISKTLSSPDRRLIFNDLKLGKKIDGAELVKSKESLRIK